MAHFSQLDENNIVLQVTVVNNSDILDENGNESEEIGIQFCKNLLGQDTKWVQTSYNSNFRYKYAGIGDFYDEVHQVFIPPGYHYDEEYNRIVLDGSSYSEEFDEFILPQPHPMWWYDPERKKWRPPFPKPMTTHQYEWDESISDWKQVEGSSIQLDVSYNDKNISNIITVTQKLFNHGFLNIFYDKFPQHKKILHTNYCYTKVRYYHDGDYYAPHTDINHDFLAFSYFNREPRKFTGGELFFPEYGDYEFKCTNNSLILLPSYVTHGVKWVSIEDTDYYSGNGRYCISHFFGVDYQKAHEN